MSDLNATREAAASKVSKAGGFPEQEQQPPGSTTAMNPVPDHGEDTWVGRDRLVGLKALITGGDSGIGRAVAIAFAREGCDVALSYLSEEQSDAEDVARLVEEAGRRCVLLPGDLQDESTCRQVVDEAAEQLGGLDVLVNNAGFQWGRRNSGLADLETEEMDRVFRTNLYGLFWVTQQALEHLGEGASIINVSSIQAYDPSTALIDYAATKAAINNFTVNLAAEVGPKGIRVNAVAPGPVWTPLQPATKKGESMPKFGEDTPLGRAGQPSELAGAFVYLASPAEASYVSGTVLGVTGGKPVF
ncbi:SDR family oxidoreductase [Propioniciclava sp. MC1683]|uniref:SDR family oxidoreductase n=1 Tax=Propioniciclava sp. MC1683 TaxID=2760309 RepID=UPI0015FFB996|nr:SDR family oxidoreductase [Propioniciclava sp. MC1683]MBB1502725.1 SDR family oxidoreductase [Propioniciclava sp. MC1683]